MSEFIAKRFVLDGQVQGVGCRAQVHDLIHAIGHVSGSVRNLPDGTVEVLVKGPDWRVTDIEEVLRERLHPPVRVDRFTSESVPLDAVAQTGFVIAR